MSFQLAPVALAQDESALQASQVGAVLDLRGKELAGESVEASDNVEELGEERRHLSVQGLKELEALKLLEWMSELFRQQIKTWNKK